jgi:hypothetical protein
VTRKRLTRAQVIEAATASVRTRWAQEPSEPHTVSEPTDAYPEHRARREAERLALLGTVGVLGTLATRERALLREALRDMLARLDVESRLGIKGAGEGILVVTRMLNALGD